MDTGGEGLNGRNVSLNKKGRTECGPEAKRFAKFWCSAQL